MIHRRLSQLLSCVKLSNALANAEPSRRQNVCSTQTAEQTVECSTKETVNPQARRKLTTINDLPLEILQHILSFLDCLALLKSRCVCPLWADCIPGTSSDLQRALFLPTINTRPSPLQAVLYFEIFTTAPTNYPRYARARVLSIPRVTKIALAFQTRCVDVHPLLAKIDRFLVAMISDLDLVQAQAEVNDFHFTHLKSLSGDLVQPDAVSMLRNVFATSPPVTLLHLRFRYVDREFGEIEPKIDRCNCSLEDSEGVLFGDVWYALEMQIRGLLRLETMRRIDARPERSLALEDLRDKIRDTICPV